jgi:hypothetical protein
MSSASTRDAIPNLGSGRPLGTLRLKAMRAQGGIKCFVFDMNGVIFWGAYAWLDTARAYEAEEEAIKTVDQRMEVGYAPMAVRARSDNALWLRTARRGRE